MMTMIKIYQNLSGYLVDNNVLPQPLPTAAAALEKQGYFAGSEHLLSPFIGRAELKITFRAPGHHPERQ